LLISAALFCCSRQWVMSAAADVWTLSRHWDYEAETHNHNAEQDRLGEGESGQGTARSDRQVRSR